MSSSAGSPAYTNETMEKFYEVFVDAFSGAAGGVVAQSIFYPLENFRTRLQAK